MNLIDTFIRSSYPMKLIWQDAEFSDVDESDEELRPEEGDEEEAEEVESVAV